MEAATERARALLARARRVTVLTGAGISTDSGIPDFRGPQGIWTKNPAAERLATIEAYLSDPEVRKLAWRTRLEEAERRREPNRGHRALVDLERQGRLDTLVTQNVDGLHHAAGSDPARIIEIHGSTREAVCLRCGARGPIEPVLERVRSGEDDPRCREVDAMGSSCDGMLKAATISFGQPLVPEDLERAEAAARRCDLMLAIGTTLAVYPAAGLVPLARAHGAAVVIVNGEPTEMDALADVVVRGPISEILPRIVASAA
jgi:NAD-dependent deacetylase